MRPQDADGALEQRALPEREQSGLVGRAGSALDHGVTEDLVATHRDGRRPPAIADSSGTLAAARKAHEATRHNAVRLRQPRGRCQACDPLLLALERLP